MLVSICFSLGLSLSAFAQGTTSRVIGVVVDPTGASVAGATVRLTNEGTNQSFTATTAMNGAYFFEAVQPGNYSVQVEMAGFSRFITRNNQVSIGQPATINVTLEVGTLAEVVEVSGSAELVQTSSSGNLGNVFTENVIKDMPIVGTRGRNPLDLVLRQPGVVSGANTGGGVHVNGARDRAWNFTVDGIDANETSAGGSNFAPIRMNPDGLAEFKVLTGNATAEFGRNSGGQVAMITKSGTNEIHGSAFWFYRTPRLNANEWENNINNVGKRQFVQNIPGGSIGGPVIRNKFFYYGNLQMLRARESAVLNRTVYTEQARQGIWRYVRGGRNFPAGTPNASVDASGNVLPGLNIGAYNVVQMDPQRLGLDPRVKALNDGTPLPNNFTGGDGLNTAFFTFPALQQEKQYDLTTKFDYILNDRNTVFARISVGRQDTNCDRVNGGSPWFPGGPCVLDTKRDPKNYAFNWRSTTSPSTTNEFVFGLNQFAFDFVYPTSDLTKIQLAGAPVTVPEIVSFGNRRQLKTWQIVDNFAWFRGAHNIKFGANIRLGRHEDLRGSIAGFNATQSANFSRLINTVNATAFGLPTDINAIDRQNLESSINYQLGRVGATNRGFVAEGDRYVEGLYNYLAKYDEHDFYIQDTWKVRRNLTVDLGLRLEMKLTPRAGINSIRRPDQVMVAGAAPTDTAKWVEGSLYRSDWNNLGPSIGVAWAPGDDGKTSVRVNYRIAYDRINTFVLSSSVFQNLPGIVDGVEDQTFGQAGGRLRDLRLLSPPTRKPSELAQPAPFSTRNITVVDPNMETPTTHQWSLSLQRQVMRNTVVEVNYIGRRAHNLFGAYNANQIEVFRNGFAAEAQRVKAGGDSPVINQLLSVDPRRQAAETGSAAFRRLYPTELANNALGTIVTDLSRRLVGGRPLPEASGVGKHYFIAYPQFAGALNVIDSNDFSTYHAFQAQIERRLSAGLTFQAGYTFSKSLDTRSFDPAFTVVSSGGVQSAGSTPSDIYDRRGNYALSDFDRTHVFQTYWLYELPFGRGRRFGSGVHGLTERIIGGWQVAGFGTIGGGRPFSVYSGFTTFNNVVQSFANCANCTRDLGSVFDGPGGVKWYLTADEIAKFSSPGFGEQGNTGRNFLRGPGSIGFDASILKRTAINERWNVELRADVTNFLNTPVFGFPTASTASTLFGRIRDTVISGSRKIQLGAKINF